MSLRSALNQYQRYISEKRAELLLVSLLLLAAVVMVVADMAAPHLSPLAEFAIDLAVFAALIPILVRHNVTQALKARQEGLLAQEAALREDRRRLARELHDSIAQHLCYLHLKLDELTQRDNGAGALGVAGELEQMRNVANKAYEDIYCLMSTLRAGASASLIDTLRARVALVDHPGNLKAAVVEVGAPRNVQACYEQEIALIVREALANVDKHAHASHVDVTVRWNTDRLDISVHDDGQGFDPAAAAKTGHFGLEVMRERAAEIGGSLIVRSHPGHGTVVELSAPLDRITDSAPGPCA